MAEKLFMTDNDIAKIVGISHEKCQPVLKALEKEGLPLPDPLFENRRYWPAVKAFLDQRYGLGLPTAPPALDGQENWKSKRKLTSRTSRRSTASAS